jgi:hypothetical protein
VRVVGQKAPEINAWAATTVAAATPNPSDQGNAAEDRGARMRRRARHGRAWRHA